jgi:hypothetical protein
MLMTSCTAPELTREGIKAMRTGDIVRAQGLLCQALQINPTNVDAWLWLSGAVGSDPERRYCLEQVLALNPEHPVARRGLNRLKYVRFSLSPLFNHTTEQQLLDDNEEEPLYEREVGGTAPTPSANQPAEPSHAQIMAILQTMSSASQPIVIDSSPNQTLPIDSERYKQRIQSALVRHRTRTAAVQQIANDYNLAWNEADELVQAVEDENLSTSTNQRVAFYSMIVVALLAAAYLADLQGMVLALMGGN